MGNYLVLPTKLVGATQRVPFDFISLLAVGETISSATVAIVTWAGYDPTPTGVLSGVATISGTKVTQMTTAGTTGVVYRLACTAVTSLSQTLVLVAYLAVVDDPLAGTVPGNEQPLPLPSGVGLLSEKSATVLSPVTGDTVTLFFTDIAIRVSSLVAVLVGGSSPSVTYHVYWGASRTSGTAVVTAGNVVTSTTSGTSVTTFDSPSIPALSFVWIVLDTVVGAPSEFSLTLKF